MEEIEIFGDVYAPAPSHCRTACRGIVVRDDQILLSYEANTDQWFLPGGGLEENETPEECCIREVGEETGVVVRILQPLAVVKEFYGDWLFENWYFVCEQTGRIQRSPTSEEIENGLEPRWLAVDEAMAVFAAYRAYADTDPLKYGTYLREHKVLAPYAALTGR